MMEIEREKRDKLASARRKLNEYKLSRSGGKTAPAVSSKPADVPSFYQNINSPPSSTQNFFNPAAVTVDNNNVTSTPAFSFFTPSPTTTATSSISTPADAQSFSTPPFQLYSPAQQNVELFTPSTGSTDTSFHYQQQQPHQNEVIQPFNFFEQPQPQQAPAPVSTTAVETTTPSAFSSPPTFGTDSVTTDQTQEDATISNPFAMPLPTAEPTLLSVFSTGENDNDGSKSTSEPFFVPSSNSEPLPQTFSFFDSISSVPTSDSNQGITQQSNSSSIAPFDIQVNPNPIGEFVPSAPPVDAESSSLSAHVQDSNPPHEIDEENAEEGHETDIPSNRSVKTENSENTDPEVQQAFADPHPPVNLFAPSIFESSANNSAVDDVFNGSSGATSKTFEMLSMSPLEAGKQETLPSIFNPLTSAPDYHHDQELPVFEVIEKSDLLTAAVQNESIQKTLQDPIDQPVSIEPIMECSTVPVSLSEHNLFSTPSATSTETSQLQSDSDMENRFREAISEAARDSAEVSVINTEASKNVPEVRTDPEQTTSHHTQTPFEDESERFTEAFDQMKSVQDALELQIEELRRENNYLLNRQTELTLKIEESERLAHEFKLEKDRVKEESLTTSQALRAKINSLCEENQRIVKNSTDVGVDLRAKLEEKTKQLEEMQKAAIVLSQSKMEFASRLDHEQERVKELQRLVHERDDEILGLRYANQELQEKLKTAHQKDAIIHQFQDQSHHYQVQAQTLCRELEALKQKLRLSNESNQHPIGPINQQQQHNEGQQPQPTVHKCGHDHDHSHEHEHNCHDTKSQEGIVQHSEEGESKETEIQDASGSCGHDHHEDGTHSHHHSHDEGHDHSHGESHHSHDDSHQHHDHGAHEHDHGHHHHHHGNDEGKMDTRRGPTDQLTELKKRLHRLEWENSSFRNELDILAVDAKQKRSYEEKCAALEEENGHLKKEVEHLEHVIIQLQGENDTIGDYISLYQSQKLALRECAKEKDEQLELLAREREMLLHRLAELTALVQDLKDSKSEAGSQCADDHMHSPLEHNSAQTSIVPRNKHQIEGKIRDLLSEISSSTLIENFHPCAVCSGRLMTV